MTVGATEIEVLYLYTGNHKDDTSQVVSQNVFPFIIYTIY